MQSLPGVANLEFNEDEQSVVVIGDEDTFDVEAAQQALADAKFAAEETEMLNES